MVILTSTSVLKNIQKSFKMRKFLNTTLLLSLFTNYRRGILHNDRKFQNGVLQFHSRLIAL
jgi:hypothetical protein